MECINIVIIQPNIKGDGEVVLSMGRRLFVTLTVISMKVV